MKTLTIDEQHNLTALDTSEEATATQLKPEHKAKAGAPAAKGGPARAKPRKKAIRSKKASKAQKVARVPESHGPREGSKTAQVVAMLKRKNGAALTEIMEQMGWQKHYADVQIMPTGVGNPACGAGIAAMKSA